MSCADCDALDAIGEAPCDAHRPITMSGKERADAERSYERGMVRRGELEPADEGDTSDLWRDGW